MILYIELLLLLFTVMATLFLHELGHYLGARERGIKSVIKWGGLVTVLNKKDGQVITKEDIRYIALAGIILGAIPLFIYGVSSLARTIYVLPIVMYYFFVGCKHDFRMLKK
jgi:hypothetical protein